MVAMPRVVSARNGSASVTPCSSRRRKPPARSMPLPPPPSASHGPLRQREVPLATTDGPMRLSDFFEGRQQLALYQFMDNGPDAFCPGCTHLTANVTDLTTLVDGE